MQHIHQSSAAILTTADARPLTDDITARPPYNAFCEMGVNGSAAGLTLTPTIGSQAAGDQFAINALNRFPIMPDDLIIVNGECLAGLKNIVFIRNPTAGTLTHFTYFKTSEAMRG